MSSNETAASLPTTPIPRAAPRAAPRVAPVQAFPAPSGNRTAFKLGKISRGGGQRIVLHGAGGTMKTSLCAYAPGPVAFFDFDLSLPRLYDRWEELGLIDNVTKVDGADTWADMLAALRCPEIAVAKTIVIDTATKAEELCLKYIFATIPKGDGSTAERIEDYEYGKGYSYVFDEWNKLLCALDILATRGQHVVLVCHDCSSVFANAEGCNFLRFEPLLQTSTNGKASSRLRTIGWADHVVWCGRDVAVGKDKKGKGAGTVTLHFTPYVWAIAKSRTMTGQMPMDEAFSNFWPLITGDKK